MILESLFGKLIKGQGDERIPLLMTSQRIPRSSNNPDKHMFLFVSHSLSHLAKVNFLQHGSYQDLWMCSLSLIFSLRVGFPSLPPLPDEDEPGLGWSIPPWRSTRFSSMRPEPGTILCQREMG